jgi:hypothetical protein
MKQSVQQISITEVLKTYPIFKKMNQYPNLMGLICSILMNVLKKKGIITSQQLHEQAQAEMKGDGFPFQYLDMVMDS